MDAAALSLKVDSSSVVAAANDLDRFSASAAKAGASANIPVGSIAKLVATVQSMNTKLSAIVGSLDKASAGLNTNAKAAQGAAAANDNVARALEAADSHVVAYTQHLAMMAAQQQDANAHVIAWQTALRAQASVQGDANAHVLAYRDSLSQVAEGAESARKAIKFTAQDSLNATRQLADIGVTAAMGMSPFMIAIQQGPQLLDILQNKAATTGQSLGTVFKAAGAAIWAALLPLLPIILPIIAALALATAGIAAMTKQANDDSGLKKYTTAMGYTKAEVAKLNAVTVTWGDTAKAVFQVGWERIAAAFGISSGAMTKAWGKAVDFMVSAARASVAVIYALFTGSFYAIAKAYENAKQGKFENPFTTMVDGYKTAYGQAQKGMDAIVKQSAANARARQDTMAKAMYDAPKVPKGPKTDAEKFSDIVRNAQAEIDTEKARADAVGLSARAAAELEQRTKLLNNVKKAGIPVTDTLTAKVNDLAKAYADAKIAADSAAAIQGVVDGYKKQNDAINDQLSLVGSYGDALTKARIETEALAAAQNALPKGETLSGAQATQVLDSTKPVVRDQNNLDRATRMEKVRKDAEDAAYAMDLEQKGLTATGEAAIAYSYTMDKLNESRVSGHALDAEELAQLKQKADAYAAQRYAIDQQIKALADAREVTRGFFADWIDGARNGANVFKAFADAIINSLNRIIDKLLDRVLDSFLDTIFKGGSGALSNLFGGKTTSGAATAQTATVNALGGVYGTPQRFALGGTFTNSVVDHPTLFRFANGGALGEMGEAGPEAIMPLKRGPNGSLGVQMHGGGKPSIRMGDVHNTYQVAGAIDQSQIVAMVRQGGEATYNQVKRDLQTLLQQLDTDGAFAS